MRTIETRWRRRGVTLSLIIAACAGTAPARANDSPLDALTAQVREALVVSGTAPAAGADAPLCVEMEFSNALLHQDVHVRLDPTGRRREAMTLRAQHRGGAWTQAVIAAASEGVNRQLRVHAIDLTGLPLPATLLPATSTPASIAGAVVVTLARHTIDREIAVGENMHSMSKAGRDRKSVV